jgi:hypothetical protein
MTNYDPMNEDLAKDVINDRYNDLATAMAVNSLCHKAIGDPFGPTDKAILGKNVPEPKPSRVIVVVGAGASHAACGLLLGDQAREKLVEAMKKHVRFADGMGDQKEAERSNPIQRRIDNLALEFNLPTMILRPRCLPCHYLISSSFWSKFVYCTDIATFLG